MKPRVRLFNNGVARVSLGERHVYVYPNFTASDGKRMFSRLYEAALTGPESCWPLVKFAIEKLMAGWAR